MYISYIYSQSLPNTGKKTPQLASGYPTKNDKRSFLESKGTIEIVINGFRNKSFTVVKEKNGPAVMESLGLWRIVAQGGFFATPMVLLQQITVSQDG